MLLPAGVRAGLASCSGPLVVFSGPSPCNGLTGRKNSGSNRLYPSGRHRTTSPGSCLTRSLLSKSWATFTQRRDARANSSLSRAKEALRKSRLPQQPGGKPQTSTSKTGNIAATLSPKELELKNAKERERKLTADYYEAVSRDKDILWMDFEELKGVPASLATRWHFKPAKSKIRKAGIMRRNVNVGHLASYVSDPDVRKKLTLWEQDTCERFTQQFKEMLRSRADLARSAGFNSYFDYRSQERMMSTSSVKGFLHSLNTQIKPLLNNFMESIFKQKYDDLNYDKSWKELIGSLKYHGKSLRDLQYAHPDTQVNWGDVICKSYLQLQFCSCSQDDSSHSRTFYWCSIDQDLCHLPVFIIMNILIF